MFIVCRLMSWNNHAECTYQWQTLWSSSGVIGCYSTACAYSVNELILRKSSWVLFANYHTFHFVSSLNERGTLHIWIRKSKCPWYLQVSLNWLKLISHCNIVFRGHSSFWYWNMLSYDSTQKKINLAINFSSLDLFESDFFYVISNLYC